MHITFKNVKYKNLLSTGNVFTTIDLDKSSTTLISGSNGSGKCLRGDTVVNIKCDDKDVNEKLKNFLKK